MEQTQASSDGDANEIKEQLPPENPRHVDALAGGDAKYFVSADLESEYSKYSVTDASSPKFSVLPTTYEEAPELDDRAAYDARHSTYLPEVKTTENPERDLEDHRTHQQSRWKLFLLCGLVFVAVLTAVLGGTLGTLLPKQHTKRYLIVWH